MIIKPITNNVQLQFSQYLEVRMENMIIMALNGFQKIKFLRLPLEICLLPKSWLVEITKYISCIYFCFCSFWSRFYPALEPFRFSIIPRMFSNLVTDICY